MTAIELAAPQPNPTTRPPGWINGKPGDTAGLAALIGGAAIAFSVLDLLSDLIELAQGGFSTPQLALTYAAEAAIPVFVLGLFAVHRPSIGALGFVGAVTYAYTFVFFEVSRVMSAGSRCCSARSSAACSRFGL